MNINELRIGNFIYLYNELITITAICYSFEDINKGITPILITEEWLLKFGFKSLFNGAGYVKNNTEIGYNHNGFYIIASGLEIKYIHQLQNLYFALTGEELSIKIESYIGSSWQNSNALR